MDPGSPVTDASAVAADAGSPDCEGVCADPSPPIQPPPVLDGGPGEAGAVAQPPGADADAGAMPKDNARPEGVALCYSELSSQHAATQAFWDALRGGDFEARPAAIEALTQATVDYPEEEEFFLLLGLAQLWRVAEPHGLESLDLAGLLEAITASEEALERAYSLCPTDHRIPAWLGPIKVRSGRNSGDQALVDEGFALLEQGIEHYPGFVLFSKFLVYADLPADDPDFLLAVEAVRDNTSYCGEVTGLSQDPACRNHYRAAHNVEGAMVFTGDMYAKAQDREAALEAYQNARRADEWAQWDYQDLLQERIDTLDARMAAHATTGFALDDHEVAWEATNQCSLCHRE